ncbi:MAG TPA: RNA polymerase sigma factor [Oligoflexus sp.]|uniref:RNA polymerase sigma factor n=1 Tax=Oligoflexus sp. TaxID=1971216 RepID=UPI002D54E109|nr:RNA polymerase sigma factor [Oligoflexus sp.]HYX35878.1 RNA polymerase sigma factor [Oligoflexus sp.]
MIQVEKPEPAARSFEDIYAAYIGLVQFAMSKFRFSVQVQEDLIQEVFLRYLENKMRLGTENPKCFLVTIARNLAIDFYRKQKRRHMDRHYPVEDVMQELFQVNEDEHHLQLQAVSRFLDSLRDDPQASTLVQYYDENLSIKEIAARSQESMATISSRLSRQRRRYRAQLEHEVESVGYASGCL